MGVPAEGVARPDERRVVGGRRSTIACWVLFAAIAAVLGHQVLLADFRDNAVLGDSASYLLQAESLGYAGHDLSYDQRDVDQFRAFLWAHEPNGLYFQRNDHGWAFAKPYGYSAYLAPFLRALGPRYGVSVANLTLLAALGLVGGATLRLRYRGAIVPVVLGTFLFASPLYFYAFHLWVEVFWAPLVMATLYALLRATRGDGLRWALVGAGLAAFLVAEKAPALPLVAPLVALALLRLPGWRPRAATVAAGLVVLVVACVPYLHASDGASWTAYGGERYYTKSGVPFAGNTTSWSRVATDETFSTTYIADTIVDDLPDKARSAAYYVVGRHTGVLVFQPLALFLVVAALATFRRLDAAGRAVLLGIAGYVGFYVVLFSANYNGGGQTFGNRYFLQAYPAVLALVVSLELRARVLLACSAASAVAFTTFLGPHLLDGRHALRDMDDTTWIQDRLPFEGNQEGADYFRCGRNGCPEDAADR